MCYHYQTIPVTPTHALIKAPASYLTTLINAIVLKVFLEIYVKVSDDGLDGYILFINYKLHYLFQIQMIKFVPTNIEITVMSINEA